MIPITVALVGGESAGVRSRWRPFALTISYAIGLALVYALLGLAAGLSGTLFGTVSTNPWLLFAMGNLLLLFALVMLDALPVPVPQSWLERASRAGERRTERRVRDGRRVGRGRGPVRRAGDGGGAHLGGQYPQRDARLRVSLRVSFGMTALLIVVGTFPGALARLPKAGAWMVWVKRLFALIMIGAAEYYFVTMGQVLL